MRVRPFQVIWGIKSSEIQVCNPCFSILANTSQEIRDKSGELSCAINSGAAEIPFTLEDGRKIILRVAK
jgi:hypothetical protein